MRRPERPPKKTKRLSRTGRFRPRVRELGTSVDTNSEGLFQSWSRYPMKLQSFQEPWCSFEEETNLPDPCVTDSLNITVQNVLPLTHKPGTPGRQRHCWACDFGILRMCDPCF